MHILVLCNRIPYPLKDGGAIATFRMIEGLYLAGALVDVFCLNTDKHYLQAVDYPDLFSQIADFQAVDVKTSPTPMGAFQNLFQNQSYHEVRFYQSAFKKLLVEKLKKKKYDIIHLESVFMGVYLSDIKLHSDAAVACRTHNVEYRIWEKLSANYPLLHPLKHYFTLQAKRLKRFEKSILKQVDLIVSITRQDANHFSEWFVDKPMAVVAAGIQSPPENPMQKPQPNQLPGVFHLGSMDWRPNVEAMNYLMKDIWPLVHQKYPNLTFKMAGRNMPKAFFHTNVPQLEVVGEVEDAGAFMQQLHIMLVPLKSGSGMRLKVVEAMALGKVVISSPLGVEGLAVEHGKHLFIAEKPEDYVAFLGLLCQNSDLLMEVSQAAFNWVKRHYDFRVLGQKVKAFYGQYQLEKTGS